MTPFPEALQSVRRGWYPGGEAFRTWMLKQMEGKLALAARLRRETTLSIKQIAERVHLGTSKSANVRLHAWMARAARDDSAQGRFQL